MTDLRLRLIAALHNADCGCTDTPTHFAAQYTPQADAALSVFAEWLRERGQRWPEGMTAYTQAGDEFRALADEIAPKPQP